MRVVVGVDDDDGEDGEEGVGVEEGSSEGGVVEVAVAVFVVAAAVVAAELVGLADFGMMPDLSEIAMAGEFDVVVEAVAAVAVAVAGYRPAIE